MKYFALSQDGLHTYIKKEIVNSLDVMPAIQKKSHCPNWYLSISGTTGKIDCNPAAPLFIYGAIMCHIIIDQNNNVVYNDYAGSQFCNTITKRYLDAA